MLRRKGAKLINGRLIHLLHNKSKAHQLVVIKVIQFSQNEIRATKIKGQSK